MTDKQTDIATTKPTWPSCENQIPTKIIVAYSRFRHLLLVTLVTLHTVVTLVNLALLCLLWLVYLL